VICGVTGWGRDLQMEKMRKPFGVVPWLSDEWPYECVEQDRRTGMGEGLHGQSRSKEGDQRGQ
jgi:hypothetical protein